MTSEAASPGPDPLVQTALQLLPVPDHGSRFWSELGAALEAESDRLVEPALAPGPVSIAVGDATEVAPRPAAAPPLTGAVASRRLVPEELRSRSNAVLAAIAVTAMLVVIGAGLLLLHAHSGGV